MYAETRVRPGAVFKNVEEFDQYVGSRILSDLRSSCPSFTGEGLRYHISLGCSMAVGVSGQGCNGETPVPLVCKDILSASLESMKTLSGGACAIPLPIQQHVDNIGAQSACRPPSESEYSRCGFVTEEEQKNYCLYNNAEKEECCKSFQAPKVEDVAPKKDKRESNKNFKHDYKTHYLGTSMFIFAAVGTTIGCIILATLAIFFAMKSKIQQDRRPPTKKVQNTSKPQLAADERTSFYF
jgi:hypothetical protein